MKDENFKIETNPPKFVVPVTPNSIIFDKRISCNARFIYCCFTHFAASHNLVQISKIIGIPYNELLLCIDELLKLGCINIKNDKNILLYELNDKAINLSEFEYEYLP